MICVKLQYSVICQEVQEAGLEKILHGFKIGYSKEFYVVNKWIWDDLEQAEDGFFQVTEILRNNKVLAASQSDIFNVKLSHTHQNYFKNILFAEEGNYRIRVGLYDQQSEIVKAGSLEYPIFVR